MHGSRRNLPHRGRRSARGALRIFRGRSQGLSRHDRALGAGLPPAAGPDPAAGAARGAAGQPHLRSRLFAGRGHAGGASRGAGRRRRHRRRGPRPRHGGALSRADCRRQLPRPGRGPGGRPARGADRERVGGAGLLHAAVRAGGSARCADPPHPRRPASRRGAGAGREAGVRAAGPPGLAEHPPPRLQAQPGLFRPGNRAQAPGAGERAGPGNTRAAPRATRNRRIRDRRRLVPVLQFRGHRGRQGIPMSEHQTAGREPDDPEGLDPKELDRIERLRDRTDEIELIISGLTTVALFTLPGMLFETFSQRFSHQSFAGSQIVDILLVILPGLFYALGGCFAVHLMIRAYWAGLVGLRSVYPGGIVWKRVPGVGRMTREHYRSNLPDLRRAIASVDQPERLSEISLWIMLSAFIGGPGLLWLLDAVLGERLPGLAERPFFRSTVRALIRFNAWIWPQRLILPVQLTLQTNTRPFLFTLLTAAGSIFIVTLGFVRYEAWTSFTLSDQFRYLGDEAIEGGIDSAHYESLRGAPDRLRPVPTIDGFEQRSAFVRVFLPYYPMRDNPVLDDRCPVELDPVDCLRGLWTLRLGNLQTAPATLLPTERRDLNQRGLTGVLPLTGLTPGLHVLEVEWNASDDPDASRTYRIPFLFSPDQELGARDVESA